MDIVIWLCRSIYKMIIVLILIELMKIDTESYYSLLIPVVFFVSAFSSIPYDKD